MGRLVSHDAAHITTLDGCTILFEKSVYRGRKVACVRVYIN